MKATKVVLNVMARQQGSGRGSAKSLILARSESAATDAASTMSCQSVSARKTFTAARRDILSVPASLGDQPEGIRTDQGQGNGLFPEWIRSWRFRSC